MFNIKIFKINQRQHKINLLKDITLLNYSVHNFKTIYNTSDSFVLI